MAGAVASASTARAPDRQPDNNACKRAAATSRLWVAGLCLTVVALAAVTTLLCGTAYGTDHCRPWLTALYVGSAILTFAARIGCLFNLPPRVRSFFAYGVWCTKIAFAPALVVNVHHVPVSVASLYTTGHVYWFCCFSSLGDMAVARTVLRIPVHVAFILNYAVMSVVLGSKCDAQFQQPSRAAALFAAMTVPQVLILLLLDWRKRVGLAALSARQQAEKKRVDLQDTAPNADGRTGRAAAATAATAVTATAAATPAATPAATTAPAAADTTSQHPLDLLPSPLRQRPATVSVKLHDVSLRDLPPDLLPRLNAIARRRCASYEVTTAAARQGCVQLVFTLHGGLSHSTDRAVLEHLTESLMPMLQATMQHSEQPMTPGEQMRVQCGSLVASCVWEAHAPGSTDSDNTGRWSVHVSELPQPGTDGGAPAARLGLVRASASGHTPADAHVGPTAGQPPPLRTTLYVQVWDLACAGEVVGWTPPQDNAHDTPTHTDTPAPLQLLVMSGGGYLTTTVEHVSRDGPLTVVRVNVAGTESSGEQWPEHGQACGAHTAAQLLVLPLSLELWHSGMLLDTAHTVVRPPHVASAAVGAGSTLGRPVGHSVGHWWGVGPGLLGHALSDLEALSAGLWARGSALGTTTVARHAHLMQDVYLWLEGTRACALASGQCVVYSTDTGTRDRPAPHSSALRRALLRDLRVPAQRLGMRGLAACLSAQASACAALPGCADAPSAAPHSASVWQRVCGIMASVSYVWYALVRPPLVGYKCGMCEETYKRWHSGYIAGLQPLMSGLMVLSFLVFLRTESNLLSRPLFMSIWLLWCSQHACVVLRSMQRMWGGNRVATGSARRQSTRNSVQMGDSCASSEQDPVAASCAGTRAYIIALCNKSVMAAGLMPLPVCFGAGAGAFSTVGTFVAFHFLEVFGEQLQASACLSAPVMLMAACLEAEIVFWASQELVTSGKWTAAGLRVACVATLVLPRLLLDGNLRRSKVWLTRVQKPHMD